MSAQLIEDDLFDRKTFDPVANHAHRVILAQLRQIGSSRWNRFHWKGEHDRRHHQCCSSLSMRNLNLIETHEDLTYLDIGCGNSPDCLIAASLGYKAYGLDLFPPSSEYGTAATFIKADVCEGIPLESESVYAVTSQAMIDLVEPNMRLKVYQEVYRVLKQGGVFSQTGVNLHSGYGFSNKEETDRARQAGFRCLWGQANGFLAVK